MPFLSIHLTDQCNNSCKFCVVNSYREKQEGVNRKIIYRFLEENVSKGYGAVNIHGGEPTVLENLPDLLAKIKQCGYSEVWLQTNARRLSDLSYAREIAALGVTLFIVSIHGVDRQMHDSITSVEGSFDQAVQGIVNVKSLGCKVRTNTVVCQQNYRRLDSIVELVIDHQVDHVNISALHPAGRAYKNFFEVTPLYSDIYPHIGQAIEAAVARDVVVTLEGFPPCTVKGYEKYKIRWENFQFKLLFHNRVLANYAEFMDRETRIKGSPCRACAQDGSCGGVYKEYIEFYGWEKFVPFT